MGELVFIFRCLVVNVNLVGRLLWLNSSMVLCLLVSVFIRICCLLLV